MNTNTDDSAKQIHIDYSPLFIKLALHRSVMAEGGDGQEERRRIGMFRRAWRARWQRVRAGTPPPLVPDDSNYVRKLFWTKFNESGFPNRVNHAVASHR